MPLTFGGAKNEKALARFKNPTVVSISSEELEAATTLLQRGMRLAAMIQDGELQLMSDAEDISIRPIIRMKP
jgi:uncharacterized protein YaeQ